MKPRGRGSDTRHLHTPEVAAKRSASLRGSEALRSAVRKIHARRIASGEDAAIRAKIRATRIANGDWLDVPQTEYQRYCKAVRRVTSKQDLTALPNHEHRGRGPNQFHLDHFVSKKSGFEHSIPPEIIGNIANLRFVLSGENCSKQGSNNIDEITNLYYRMSVEIPV